MGKQNDTLETIFRMRRSCRAYNMEKPILREDLELSLIHIFLLSGTFSGSFTISLLYAENGGCTGIVRKPEFNLRFIFYRTEIIDTCIYRVKRPWGYPLPENQEVGK